MLESPLLKKLIRFLQRGCNIILFYMYKKKVPLSARLASTIHTLDKKKKKNPNFLTEKIQHHVIKVEFI